MPQDVSYFRCQILVYQEHLVYHHHTDSLPIQLSIRLLHGCRQVGAIFQPQTDLSSQRHPVIAHVSIRAH